MKNYETFTKEKMLYLYKATKPIKYKKLQNRIYFELSNHIDDMFCDYIDEGMSEKDATEKFLNEMGNPEELGEELKKTHRRTLRFAKFQKVAIVLAVFALIISAFGYFESKDNLKMAKQYELPEETIELEKSLITYTKLEYWSFPIDIYFYTDISWLDLDIDKPLYKVKDCNLFNDYYVIDESQSVVVDLAYAMHGAGKIYVDDVSKLPASYHSDKLSKVVIDNYDYSNDTRLEIFPDLTSSEITELERMACIFYDDYKLFEMEEDLVSTNDRANTWKIKFHIKDLEGLYYYGECDLYKSVSEKYYIGYSKRRMHTEVPKHIAVKIDKAFEDANIEF